VIHIIGAGGTGGWLIPALAKMADPRLFHVWDGDDVEEKNVLRQNFSQVEVGEAKAVIMLERYGIGMVTSNYFDAMDVMEIRDGDTVFICADNFHVRALIDERCAELDDITLINGGNELTTTTTQIYVKRDGVAYTPRISYMHDEIKRGTPKSELDCAVVANLPGGEQTVAANMLSASMMLMAIMRVGLWESQGTVGPDHEHPPFPWHEFCTDVLAGVAATVDWRLDGVGDWR
jgi:molybdopterin/thiamine biosynthesis adenylyltransferase